MDPLTLALIMGGGAAIKGIGQGIAGFQQAEGMMSDYEKQQMKKLQREQELGLLGFDDAEMADMRQAVINPVKALQTQQQDQLKATMAGMDAGAGSTFRAALVANEQAQQMQAVAEDKRPSHKQSRLVLVELLKQRDKVCFWLKKHRLVLDKLILLSKTHKQCKKRCC